MCGTLITRTITGVHYKESKQAGIHQSFSYLPKVSDRKFTKVCLHQMQALYGIVSFAYLTSHFIIHQIPVYKTPA